VLQDAKVLAIDQSADERATKAAVAKSVTLEVDTVDAQKLSLAASVGNLSLLLRKAGDTSDQRAHKITLKDLNSNGDRHGTATVVVTRATTAQEYNVPVEARNEDLASAARGRTAH